MAQYKDIDTILRQLDEFYITSIVQQKHDDMPEDHKKHWKGVQSGINYARNTIIETPTADVVPKSEWISVEERLPDGKVNCIVHYKHVYCDNDGYWAIGLSFYDGNEFEINSVYKITHWMPLPPPPTEKEN